MLQLKNLLYTTTFKMVTSTPEFVFYQIKGVIAEAKSRSVSYIETMKLPYACIALVSSSATLSYTSSGITGSINNFDYNLITGPNDNSSLFGVTYGIVNITMQL